ncbi:hypothetical protein EMA8858_03076 [Emticicia aquatica]|jgi:hypothetical protein|uniref:DUF6089 domain-containing protein n=1 Tax=Emticicia aquatica TaxID=1681835 RepID=A0ABN8EZV8_9BACT|nr:hypothetical protein [Emticicia aquatica]CAH0996941.1 hypothetical protein EMA8858_03076 [Emticicia aquatica]
MKLLKIKKTTYSLLICFSAMLLATQENFAQSGIFSKKNKLNQYSSVGFGGGSSHYFGDLSPYRFFYYGLITNVRWNGTVNYTRQLSPQLAARVAFSYTRIAGDDYTYSQRNLTKFYQPFLRNLHFRNDIKEFTLTGLFNLLPQYSKGPQGRSRLMPYSFIGFGFYAHNPQARDVATINAATNQVLLGGWTNLKDKQTSGQGVDPTAPKAYSLIQPVFPLGLGLKIKINEKFDLGLEGGLRITPFDYLDDVGKSNYPDPAALAIVSPLGAIFANRAGEDIAASTGASRIADFANIATNILGLATPGTPSSNGTTVFGYPNSARGTQRWDSYFTTQLTLSYIISSQVKCPPIK